MGMEFISLTDICPGLIPQMDYATPFNFTGEIVPGYRTPKAYLPEVPAQALARVQSEALRRGFSIKVFDAYRPVKAVTFFQEWAQREEDRPELKEIYYPKFSRIELFEQGFIAKQSSHSRGSAIDLTLFDLKTNRDLDMGTAFDYFDVSSNTDHSGLTAGQRKNRQLLISLMEAQGFKNYPGEWWHFSFRPEPFPGKYFDFDIE